MQFSLSQVFRQMTLLAMALGTGMSLGQGNLGWVERLFVRAVFVLSAGGLVHGFQSAKQEVAVLALIFSVGILGGLLAFRMLVFLYLPA